MSETDFLNIYPDLFIASEYTEQQLENSDNGVLFARRHIVFSDLVNKISMALNNQFSMISPTKNRLIIERILNERKTDQKKKMTSSFVQVLSQLDQLPTALRSTKSIEKYWSKSKRALSVLDVYKSYRKILREKKLLTEGDVLAAFVADSDCFSRLNMENANALRFVGFSEISAIKLEVMNEIAKKVYTKLVLNMPLHKEKHFGHVLSIENFFKKKQSKIEIDPRPFEIDDARKNLTATLFEKTDDSVKKASQDDRVKLLRPVDEAEQMKAVFNEIEDLLAKGTKPQQIGIVVNDLEQIRQKLRSAIVKRELPLAYNRSLSIFGARCFKWMYFLIDLLENGISISLLSTLHLEMQALKILPEEICNCDVQKYEAVLKKLGIEKESQKWQKVVLDWQNSSKNKDGLNVESWLKFWGEWIREWNKYESKKIWFDKFVALIAKIELPRFYSRHEVRHFTYSYHALKTYKNIANEINESGLLAEEKQSGLEFLQWIIKNTDTAIKQRSSPEPEVVSVINFSEASRKPFKHLFLLNMLEGEYPNVSLNDILLRESEGILFNKETGHNIFFSKKETYQRQVAEFLCILLNSENIRIYSPHKLNDEEKNTSLFFDELAKVIPLCNAEDTARKINTMEEWLFAAVDYYKSRKIENELQDGLAKAYDRLKDIISKIENESVRLKFMQMVNALERKEASNKYTGKLDDDWRSSTGYVLSNTLSQTWFEDYMQCPFKFYCNRVLGIKSENELQTDPDSLQIGTAIHSVLEKLYQKEKATQLKKSEKIMQIARKYLDSELMEQTKSNESVTSELVPYNSKRWEIYLDRFYQEECEKWSEHLPVMYEKTFGEDTPEDLSGKINISSKEDEPLYIRGRIDRIDETPRGHSVIDYKTGKNDIYSKCLKEEEFGITSFQMPLYILGLLQAANSGRLEKAPEEIEAEYLLIRKPGKTVNKKIDLASEESKDYFSLDPEIRRNAGPMKNLANHLEEIYQKMKNGEFEISPGNSEKNCTYCSYSDICRYDNTKIEFDEMEPEE